MRVGLNNLLTPGDAMQERNITEMIKYPEYSRQVRYHDIALIKLDRPLELNPRVRPACLEVNSQIPGNTAIVSGFGKTEFRKYLIILTLLVNILHFKITACVCVSYTYIVCISHILCIAYICIYICTYTK